MKADSTGKSGRPSISVLVALYQSARYLRTMMESLAAQNLSDAEFIFCDDASTDDTVNLLERMLAENRIGERWRVIRHSGNAGECQSRQDLLDAATGEYFIFMDPDDRVDPGMYQELLAAARAENADLVWEDYFMDMPDGRTVRHDEHMDGASSAALRRSMLKGRIHGSMCNKLIGLDFAKRTGVRFRKDSTCCGDMEFVVGLLLAAGPRVVYRQGCHYHYLQRGDSVSHGSSMPHLASFVRIASRLEGLLEDPADLAAVQAFKMRFRYCAAMDFSVPDDVFRSYFSDVRLLSSDFPSKRRLLFWLCTHGMRPLVRFAWSALHPRHLRSDGRCREKDVAG